MRNCWHKEHGVRVASRPGGLWGYAAGLLLCANRLWTLSVRQVGRASRSCDLSKVAARGVLPCSNVLTHGWHVLAACIRCPVARARLAGLRPPHGGRSLRRLARLHALAACACGPLPLGSHVLATRAARLAHARGPCPLGLRTGGRGCTKDSVIACDRAGLCEKWRQVSRFWLLFRVGERLTFSHLGFYGGLRAFLYG